ncbi:unnamed protein product [Anisakis simplex]|uniref:Uncharacterized protein n=1 Tax=Anisakis simplex TaxID=6269 RepID=A0A0M3K3H6_ANISI|nr:unnamed protein product [Anisakis simplex]
MSRIPLFVPDEGAVRQKMKPNLFHLSKSCRAKLLAVDSFQSTIRPVAQLAYNRSVTTSAGTWRWGRTDCSGRHSIKAQSTCQSVVTEEDPFNPPSVATDATLKDKYINFWIL